MSKKVDKDTRGNKWFYGSPHPPYVPLIDPSYKTPLKGESSKVTPVAQESINNVGVTPEHMRNYAPAPSKVTTGKYREERVLCEDCNGYGYHAMPDNKGRPEQIRCQDCYGLGYNIARVAVLPKPSQSTPTQANKTFALVMDIIYQWLIKQGVEVSEEAKDELAKQVKQVIGG